MSGSKILVITPIYEISGRENLFRDSSAVHYLLKYWPCKENLLVIFTYFNSFKSILRYKSKKERNFHKNGYQYEIDGIKVFMIETQLLPFVSKLNFFQRNKITKQINSYLKTNNFKPDILISHIPTYKSIMFVDAIDCEKKYAVLHETDKANISVNKRILNKINSLFDKTFARSFSLYSFFLSAGVKNMSSNVVLSGVDISNTTIQKYEQRFKRNKSFNIIYVGKLIKRKNVDLILEWMNKYDVKKITRLTIVGTGPEEKRLKKYADRYELTDRVVFCGRVNHSDVFSYYDKNDVFVMPSIRETFGLVYLEAMSRGCICIGTKNEGIEGVVVDKRNGLLVNPTIESLNAALQYLLLCDENTLRQMSDNAFKTSQEMNEKNMSINYYGIISNC